MLLSFEIRAAGLKSEVRYPSFSIISYLFGEGAGELSSVCFLYTQARCFRTENVTSRRNFLSKMASSFLKQSDMRVVRNDVFGQKPTVSPLPVIISYATYIYTQTCTQIHAYTQMMPLKKHLSAHLLYQPL